VKQSRHPYENYTENSRKWREVAGLGLLGKPEMMKIGNNQPKLFL
jgi:hypothetical protein